MNRRHQMQSCRCRRGSARRAVRTACTENVTRRENCKINPRETTVCRNTVKEQTVCGDTAREGRNCRNKSRENNCCANHDAEDCPEVPLAIATIGMQKWNCVYEPTEGLNAGTMFPCLNLPYNAGGRR